MQRWKLAVAIAPLLALCSCGDTRALWGRGRDRSGPVLPAAVKTPDSDDQRCRRRRLAAGRCRSRRPGWASTRSRPGSIIRAGSHLLPNGDVLVAETAGPGTDPGPGGLKGFFMQISMKKAGSAVPSANRITLLRDADGDGIAEIRRRLLEGLIRRSAWRWSATSSSSPMPMRWSPSPSTPGQTRIAAPPRTVTALPAGRNHHWTKSLVAAPDGSRLYVGVGSNSNVAEHGMARKGRAAVWEIDPATGPTAFSPRACATRSGSPSARRPAILCPRSTSATSSAATWFPTI